MSAAYIIDLTCGARYGAAHGLFGTIYDVGDALGPICAGLMVARAGYHAAFRAGGAAAIVFAVLFAFCSLKWHAGPGDLRSSE